MGCCNSSEEHEPSPMSGGQVVGREGGVSITRDEARARAAAAAEARAQQQQSRGQQGPKSKVKPSAASSGGYPGKPDLADARSWD